MLTIPGIMLFEMITTYPPFYHEDDDILFRMVSTYKLLYFIAFSDVCNYVSLSNDASINVPIALSIDVLIIVSINVFIDVFINVSIDIFYQCIY